LEEYIFLDDVSVTGLPLTFSSTRLTVRPKALVKRAERKYELVI